MQTKDIVDAIKDRENNDIDQAEIDSACYRRIENACRDYGSEGDKARRLLMVAAELIDWA